MAGKAHAQVRAAAAILAKTVVFALAIALWLVGLRFVVGPEYFGIAGFVTFPLVLLLLSRFVLGARLRWKRKRNDR
jgi:hypothetical protein